MMSGSMCETPVAFGVKGAKCGGNERNEGMTKTQAQVVAESAQHCALYHLHFESKTFTNVKLYFHYFYDKVK